MCLDIAADDAYTCESVCCVATGSSERGLTSKSAHEVVYLAGRRAAHRVGNTDAVDASPVDGPVEVKQVHEVGPEAVLTAEANLDTSAAWIVSSFESLRKHSIVSPWTYLLT